MRENRINKRPRSREETIEFLREQAPEAADVDPSTGKEYEIAVTWSGRNRVGLFKGMAERGWVVTSADERNLWFEKIE
jgi:hypothetical protein